MKTHTKKKNKNKKKKVPFFFVSCLCFDILTIVVFFFSISSAVFPATLSFFFFITLCRSVLHTSGALLCETCYLFFFFFTWKHAYDLCFFFFSTLRGRPAALVVADCSQAHEWTVEDLSLCFFSCFIFIFSFFSGRNVYSRYPCTPFLRYICIYMYVVRFVCSYALKAFLFPLMVLTRTLPLAVLKRLFYLFFFVIICFRRATGVLRSSKLLPFTIYSRTFFFCLFPSCSFVLWQPKRTYSRPYMLLSSFFF